MPRSKTPGAAPDPSRDLWEDMKGHGRYVADDVRSARKYGGSANPKSKIVSGLRWALNKGFDEFEGQHGRMDRPSKQDVTKWANHTAKSVMDKTSGDRRNKRYYEFGFAVATAMKAAFKKGFSIGAGTTTLLGHVSDQKLLDPTISIPEKYRHDFIIRAWKYCKMEAKGELLIFYSISNPYGFKAVYHPLVLLETPHGNETRPYEGYTDFRMSEGAVKALVKRGLMRLKDFDAKNGSVMRYASFTELGIEMAYRDVCAQNEANTKFKQTQQYRNRMAVLEQYYADRGRPRYEAQGRSSLTESKAQDLRAFIDRNGHVLVWNEK